MQCKYRKYDEKKQRWYDCDKCMDCRINQREEWSVRLTHEWKYWEKSMFITLTYEDEKLPDNCSIRKLEVSNFFHYLRNDERMQGREIKYFACGEYGDKGGIVESGRYKGLFIHRPHYHAIVFGLDCFDDNDRKLISDNWHFCPAWMFNPKVGTHGEWLDEQAIDYVTPDDINYVCGYTTKKLFGAKLDELTQKGMENPFGLQSKGIGKRYCEENRNQLLSQLCTQRKGHKLPLPRQYMKWLGIDNFVYRQPYVDDYARRHPMEHIKQINKPDVLNYDRLVKKAIEQMEIEYPLHEKIVMSKDYYNAAKHAFYRALSKEIDRQGDLALRQNYKV